MRHLLQLVLLLSLLVAPIYAQPDALRADTPFRALWVTRWDYRSPADVTQVLDRAAALGATDVLWQVRGQADAFYKSPLEPWGRELFRDLPPSATEPSFDPLALAVKEAHARGLRIHAWMNVMPMWKGTTPPAAGTSPEHLFHAHPDWRLYDAKGVPQALNDHYIIVNPVYPEVQDHIVAVGADLMRRYELDGLHLDYIRFVSETMKEPTAYPADARSIDLFRKATGATGVADPAAVQAYRAYIRDRISALVRRIKSDAVALRPGALLSAAVWRRPELARDTYLQDAAAWLNDGTLDLAIPMIYQDKNETYIGDLEAWLAAVSPARRPFLVPGLGNYKHAPEQTEQQITLARNRGLDRFALFAYASLFESADPNQDRSTKEVELRTARRNAVTAFMHQK